MLAARRKRLPWLLLQPLLWKLPLLPLKHLLLPPLKPLLLLLKPLLLLLTLLPPQPLLPLTLLLLLPTLPSPPSKPSNWLPPAGFRWGVNKKPAAHVRSGFFYAL